MVAALDHPTVSAVIPAYNAEPYISESIQSALDQTYPLAEIIVVDDGSSDRTAEVAASFPNTRVIRRPNGGPAAARNTGIQAASGEWIALLDSDDIWLPQKTEVQLAYVTPDAGVIHTNRFDTINFGNLWHRQATLSPSGVLVRRQTLLEVGGFDETRAICGVEDLNMWLKIALTDWRFVMSEVGLFRYQPTEQSLSRNEAKMARAELASFDIIGKRVHCQAEEIERVKQASRIEYAKNLIAGRKWDEATQLLQECSSGLASKWLSLAAFLKVNLMARESVVRWLQHRDGNYESHVCSGECSLPEALRMQCMETCHSPYYRPLRKAR